MILPTPRQYKKTYMIGMTEWRLKFKKNMPEKNCVGLCDPATNTIFIKQGLTHANTFYVLLHEIIHAVEFEYDFKLREREVLKLEKGLGDFILTNL